MLFINLDLILELLNYKMQDNKKNNKNKLKYYDLIANTKLEDDIKLTTKEEAIVNYFCNLEINNKSFIGKAANEKLKESLNFSL